MLDFILQYKLVILFYLAVIIFLIVKRKRVDVQGKVIFLYRMKFGLKWMDKYASKHREWVILLGYIAAGTGFIGMAFISFYLIKNLVQYFTAETIVSGASLVYPGMNVPGLGVLPFWDWIIAIFLIATIHEFAHGIVARAHNIPVKNTGIVFFGPILGAFVEPDENMMQKQTDIKQYSVLGAGAFANVILAGVALLLLVSVFNPITTNMEDNIGFSFGTFIEGDFPAEKSGIEPGMVINGIDGVSTKTFQDFHVEIQRKSPGDSITLNTQDKDYTLTLAANPDDERSPFIGVNVIKNEVVPTNNTIWYRIVKKLGGFSLWLFLLSFGIGIFNLLPLPIVDGGRMSQVFLQKWKGNKRGNFWYAKVSLFFLLLLLLNLVYPWIAKIIS
jgi:membrane-associated protease RseP (regulator of RpoE activity)